MYLILKIFLFCSLAYSSISKEEFKSNSKLELLIEEYLLNNPEIIIKSLENYRNKQEAKIEEELKYFINDYYEKKSMKLFLTLEILLLKLLLLNLLIIIVAIAKKTLQL